MNTLEPQGKEVDISMLVDSDHTGHRISGRSRSDFLIYLNTLCSGSQRSILH